MQQDADINCRRYLMNSTGDSKIPIVIAHRGASGYRPEHTLAGYELAIDLGADYIEPDLVATKDGVLIARHENEISQTTDVVNHPEFAHRRTTKIIDGESITGWFTEDFTLMELKTLTAKERLPQLRSLNTKYDGSLAIPSFQEVIDLAKGKSTEIGRVIGIYPETKHPSYFKALGLSLEDPLLATLAANGYQGEQAPIFIQSLEVGNLQELGRKTDLPLVQLLDDTGRPHDFVLSGDPRTYRDLATRSGLEEIAKYARGIGVSKNLLIPRDHEGRLQAPTSLVTSAHAAGLLVHAWTFRNEDCFLPGDCLGNPQAEYELFFGLGIDGVFSDYPDTAVAVRDGQFL